MSEGMAEKPDRGVDVDQLLRFSQSLPEVEQSDYANWIGLKVAGKGFGYLSGDGNVVMLKSTHVEQAALVATEPETFSPGHTSAESAWVNVKLATVARDELEELVTEAWYLTAPKRLTDGFDPAHPDRHPH